MVDQKPRILIIDDENVVCDVLHDELNERGYLCTTALNGNDALTKLATQDFDIALVDIRLPGISGMELLRKIRSTHHYTGIIMVTAVNDVDTAVEAMKLGALDYIVKPFELDRVNISIHTVLETKKRLSEKGERKIPPSVVSEQEDKQAIDKSFNEINAIALGVQARLDPVLGYSKIVTQRTVDIARQLGISEREVKRWVASTSKSNLERDRAIKSVLNKLERSPLAQSIAGMTELYLYIPKSRESQN